MTKVHSEDTGYKGQMRRWPEDDPRYRIQTCKTDHSAMHKDDALEQIDRDLAIRVIGHPGPG